MWRGSRANTRCAEEVHFTTEDTETRRENSEPSTTKGTKDHEVKTKDISSQRIRRARRKNSEPSTTRGTKDHKVKTKEISPQRTQRHGGKTQNLPPQRARRITK